MEKREKYGMIAAIAVAALIVASILIYPLLSQAPTPPPFSQSQFDSRMVSVGNASANFYGLGGVKYTLNNSSIFTDLYTTPPGPTVYGISGDYASYFKSGNSYSVYENITYTGGLLTIFSQVTSSKMTQSFHFNNTERVAMNYSLNYVITIGGYVETVLHMSSPSGSNGTNISIVPQTHGFTETYSFFGNGPFAASFPTHNGTMANWSDLSGLLYRGSLQFGFNSTNLDLNFSRVTLLPGQSLDLGSITIS